jgi:MerR family mercuric resistance operon transcriptional regulator
VRAGRLAAAAGVNVQTVRYYERRGLLPAPARSLGGHREYDQDTLTTLRVIRAAQRLGFTLAEIEELLELGRHRGPRPGLRERAQAKLADVDERIAALTVMRSALQDVIDAGCADLRSCSCTPGCPIPFPEIGVRRSARETTP